MVEAEHHQRVGVGEDPLVDRQLVPRLVDALVHGDGMPGRLAHELLERQRRAVEQLEGAGDALQEVRPIVLGRLVAGPGHPADLGHGREAIVHLGGVAVGLPRIAPRPVDAEPAPAPGVCCAERGSGCRCAAAVGMVMRSSYSLAERHEVAQRVDAGQEEVGAAADGGEGRQPLMLLADRPLGDREVERAVLSADDRVALVAELVERLGSLTHTFCANSNWRTQARRRSMNAAMPRSTPSSGASSGSARPVGAAAADHPAAVHVRARCRAGSCGGCASPTGSA